MPLPFGALADEGVCRGCHVQVHAGDWAEWGRMGGRKSARMRRMYAGGQRGFRVQMHGKVEVVERVDVVQTSWALLKDIWESKFEP